jgi:hypothetical protein
MAVKQINIFIIRINSFYVLFFFLNRYARENTISINDISIPCFFVSVVYIRLLIS